MSINSQYTRAVIDGKFCIDISRDIRYNEKHLYMCYKLGMLLLDISNTTN
jgi:hypothetical protein